jgi:hypothetical protein
MCDTMAAVSTSTASRIVLFGKNSDREYDEAQHLTLIPHRHHRTGVRLRLTYVEIEQVPEAFSVLLSKPH